MSPASRNPQLTYLAFRFILNHPKAIAATVYSLLYSKKTLTDAIKTKPELIESLWDEGRHAGIVLVVFERSMLRGWGHRQISLALHFPPIFHST